MKDAANRRFWDRYAVLYDRFMGGSAAIYDQIAGEMKKSLTKSMRVLELACGTGLLSLRIVGSVESLEATDFSSKMVLEAKKKVHSSRLHFSIQDATNLPYADKTFDAVVIANALHIMPDPDRALEEILHVLKPDGRLYAPTFVRGQGTGYRLWIRLMELAGFKAYSKWSTDEFIQFIEEHGFDVIRTISLGTKRTPLCYLEGAGRCL